ncbi:MAG: hypothetical protein AB7S26_39600 [Sandaracinaceae bacterium]
MSEPPTTLLDRVGVLVESRAVRTTLVVLIIVSLLPLRRLTSPEVELALTWVFLIAFGAELLVRVPLILTRRKERRAGLGEVGFLLADLAAFVSFIPLDAMLDSHLIWLRLLRLSRLLVLVRFARELAADLYSILTRREQLQQFGLVTLAVAALAFVSAVVLNQLGVQHDYRGDHEAPELVDQMWWSFRQLESADNLVASLHGHPLVSILSLALTITGVFIISFIIGIGTNVVEQVVRAERRRSVGYTGHTVVVGPIQASEILVREFVRIYVKNKRDLRDQLRQLLRWFTRGGTAPRGWRLPHLALLGPDDDPPAVLLEPGMRWVVYRQGEGTDTEALLRIGADRAKRAIVLTDPSAGADADAITVATVSALRDLNPSAHVFLELASSKNLDTVGALGQPDRTFSLDVPWFLGVFMLHHLVVPGVERLYRYLLTADGSELYSHVYRTRSELDRLVQRRGEDGALDFGAMAARAERYGAVLIGVVLGDREPTDGPYDLISLDGLVPWVNPLDEPTDPRLLELGARAGRVPASSLRGIIALADNYGPVRHLARGLTEAPLSPRRAAEPSDVTIATAEPCPRNVMIVGLGNAVASLAHRLGELADEARVTVAFDGDELSLHQLGASLAHLGIALQRTDEGWQASLPRGGRLEVLSEPHVDAMQTATRALSCGEYESIVFLSEHHAKDPDARTALRLLGLCEHLLARGGDAPHVLAELTTLQKGERARAHVLSAFERAERRPPRITLVSTEQVRNYFMVHSAFVPMINEVYAQLLGRVGQDLVRLPFDEPCRVEIAALSARLADSRMIPLAFEREDDVVVNPDVGVTYDGVTGVLAIARGA